MCNTRAAHRALMCNEISPARGTHKRCALQINVQHARCTLAPLSPSERAWMRGTELNASEYRTPRTLFRVFATFCSIFCLAITGTSRKHIGRVAIFDPSVRFLSLPMRLDWNIHTLYAPWLSSVGGKSRFPAEFGKLSSPHTPQFRPSTKASEVGRYRYRGVRMPRSLRGNWKSSSEFRP